MRPEHVLTRRSFVKGTGGMLLGFRFGDPAVLPQLVAPPPAAGWTRRPPNRLDAWLRVEPSGNIQVLTGKAEIGMGVETAYAQIVAEELDVPLERVSLVMGDTALTPDQGGVGGSTSIMQGARPLRNAAAAARILLVRLAARQLGTTVDQLEVTEGRIVMRSDRTRAVSYAELAAMEGLDEELTASGQGFTLNVDGGAGPKDPSTYRVVGTSAPRVDLAAKVLGRFRYVTDIRVDGMLHGRVVRPPGVASVLASVDDSAARAVPGYVRTVADGNFLAVVAQTEWAAVRAARALQVRWTAPASAFPEQAELYAVMRSTPPSATRETLTIGDVPAALASAATRLDATYDYPFHSHAAMGPGCAVADVRIDGLTTVWSGAQKPHALQRGLAELLGVPPDRVRVIWCADAGSYGRCGFEDVAADAVIVARAVGRPVRVQWSRADMTAWGPKGPAVTCDLSAGLDGTGRVAALQFTSRAYSGTEISPVPATAGNFLASQLRGVPNRSPGTEFAQWGVQTMAYAFPAVHALAHVLPPFQALASPMRATHLRDPNGPAATFAVESFVDELATAAGVDPVEFRLAHLDDPRAKEVLMAAAERAAWTSRRSAVARSKGESASGIGVALGLRNGTYVCTVAEVLVNRRTGIVRATRFVIAHDCGLVINPDALRATIAANLVQSLGRAMKEEVSFARQRVTSIDWTTYRVARASDVPAQVEIVLLDHPTRPPTGAGEVTSRPTAAAIANAIFHAVGARVRRCPLTPGEVRAALARRNTA